MADIGEASPSERFSVPIHWGRAISAGVIATVVMTIIGAIVKMNFPKMIGSMILPNAGVTMQYVVGGMMHLMIGIVYGIIYAALVGRVVEWNRFVKAVVYALAITAIALVAMPLMSAMMGGGSKASAGNPCHPQQAAMASGGQGAMNPCHPSSGSSNPCHMKSGGSGGGNPCHPQQAAMASGGQGAMNPCHPSSGATAPYQQASGTSNPCHMKSGGSGGGNPCNPCGGGGGPWSGVMSVANHLVYALTLAFAYGKVR